MTVINSIFPKKNTNKLKQMWEHVKFSRDQKHFNFIIQEQMCITSELLLWMPEIRKLEQDD